MSTGANRGVPAKEPPRRPWRWLRRVLTALLVLILLGGAACWIGYQMVFGARRSSEPYRMALDLVQNDPQVIEQVGGPIEDVCWFPNGEIDNDPDRGTARLDFAVAGSKTRANVHVDARRIASKWGFARLEVTPEGGKRILVNVAAANGLDEAPPFQPAPSPDSKPPAEPPQDIQINVPAPE